MTDLTATDRFWRIIARWIDRPVLAAVASQRVLRALFAFSARMGSALPAGLTMTRDRHGALWLTPRGVSPDAPVLMYLHGGGFTIGSPRTHAALAGHLAAHAGMRACIPAYRLAPEHPAPAARADAIAAYARLIDRDTPPAALAGDSAGGNLALLVAQHARDTGLPQPRALALIAPAADLTGDIAARFAAAPGEVLIPPAWARRIKRAYLPNIDPADPTISPLCGDLTGLPPALIHVGAEEALADEARRLADRMDVADLTLWPGLPHVWHLHAGRAPAADRALADLGAFLKARIS
ncbi:alpha/beta hydrolase fold domain-containing protein [Roseicyclus mahoneyensis]|uniref:Acetyl esterase/lipase n=1 Tax=Roseicyclus mahoneyensis TaxID=164332 RepID=A0A316GLR5_9RHOB|nr:alpha/beta hydrolase fold domain-containing protein [Roseicyclus mahoneyensis]PWK62110.1 acetyl esterase/lipase [Roseicyclus mahoneyensis]